jgi:hypothetical protein
MHNTAKLLTCISGIALLYGCFYSNTTAPAENEIQRLIENDPAKDHFVNEKYHYEHPLAAIVNIPAYSLYDSSFVLQQDENIQVYAVGELNVDLAGVKPQYLFQSDDMEFYFDLDNNKSDAFINQAGNHMYNFSWLDGKVKSDTIAFNKQGAVYRGYYDDSLKNYVAEIAFPWNQFNKTSITAGENYGFELAIGDNDDDLKQKAKLAWHSTTDALTTNTATYGNLKLVQDTMMTAHKDTMYSLRATPVIDGIPDRLWNDLPACSIKNIIAGSISGDDDLSAFVKTCWDDNNLYFLVRVHDPGKKRMKYERIRSIQTFHDYGWIEDSKGKKVWEMHVLDSKYAGGAFKNQQTDQVIHLQAGKYTLKYQTDESHNWNNWDDAPPNTPFYGIVLYMAK